MPADPLSPLGYTAAPHPSADEVQSLSVDATGGTYTLTITVPGNAAFTTGTIAYNANAATVKAAIDAAITGIGLTCDALTGGVGASGGGTPYLVSFSNPVKVVPNSASLTGGAHTATIGEVNQGQVRDPNGTDLTLPATSLPTKIATATPKVVADRAFSTQGG